MNHGGVGWLVSWRLFSPYILFAVLSFFFPTLLLEVVEIGAFSGNDLV